MAFYHIITESPDLLVLSRPIGVRLRLFAVFIISAVVIGTLSIIPAAKNPPDIAGVRFMILIGVVLAFIALYFICFVKSYEFNAAQGTIRLTTKLFNKTLRLSILKNSEATFRVLTMRGSYKAGGMSTYGIEICDNHHKRSVFLS